MDTIEFNGKAYGCIREMLEAREELILSPYASRSSASKGRDREERKCDVRTDYQRDRDRILKYRLMSLKTLKIYFLVFHLQK